MPRGRGRRAAGGARPAGKKSNAAPARRQVFRGGPPGAGALQSGVRARALAATRVRLMRPLGVRVIVTYKACKAILQATLAALLVYGLRHGLKADLADFALRLQEHAVHAWSNVVAAALFRFVHQKHSLMITAAALAGDAVVSAIEGWALWRGERWGSWVVIGATASLIPFEIAALIHRLHAGRVVVFAINASIVWYLARRMRHEPLAPP
jgi:uncharacterized membrane protein (DUF2068 family)